MSWSWTNWSSVYMVAALDPFRPGQHDGPIGDWSLESQTGPDGTTYRVLYIASGLHGRIRAIIRPDGTIEQGENEDALAELYLQHIWRYQTREDGTVVVYYPYPFCYSYDDGSLVMTDIDSDGVIKAIIPTQGNVVEFPDWKVARFYQEREKENWTITETTTEDGLRVVTVDYPDGHRRGTFSANGGHENIPLPEMLGWLGMAAAQGWQTFRKE